ncbi:MAG: hypothetical protein RQ758_07705 [Methanomicrobiaceae archaeon]|nr:hypothetical protein [Methanomicrobiaceae archaeon]
MSSDYFAFGALDPAIQRTKELLWPFNLGVWLRLAVISFFVGSGVGGFNPGTVYSTDQPPFGMGEMPFSFPTEAFPAAPFVILGLIIAIAIVAIIFMYLSSVFQFVFVDCLSSSNISLSRTFGERTGKGLRLLLFDVGVVAIVILAIGAIAIGLFAGGGPSNFFAVLIFVPVVIVIAILLGIILLFTIDFVVPVMVRDDCGVLEGWRRVYALTTAELLQSFLYIVAKFILSIVAGIAMLILVILAWAVIAIPFVVIGIALTAALAIGWAVLLVLLIPFLIIAVPVALIISVPFTTFFRYYSLLVLASFSPEHDLLPPAPA